MMERFLGQAILVIKNKIAIETLTYELMGSFVEMKTRHIKLERKNDSKRLRKCLIC